MKHRQTATVQRQPPSTNQTSAQNRWSDRFKNSAVLFGIVPVGSAFGRWISKLIALPQLRGLVGGPIPWTPLSKPLTECKVVLISTGGVHLHQDRPFLVDGDASYRVIPKDVQVADLAISHQAYDKTDALRDINLVFPITRLRELAAEGVIGSLAEEHYGFGLMGSAKKLLPSQKEVAKRIREAGVDLALLVPAWPICTRSVGLLGREIEAQGVTTVALGLVKEVAAAARAPRFLYLHWPFGHALGEPGNVLQQRTVLRDMLSMGIHAPRPGMVVELPYRWRREKYEPITDWSTPSEAMVSALSARNRPMRKQARIDSV